MARPVKSNEVSQLIVRHEKMNRGLMSIESACENLYNEISTTAERYVANEAVSKLREIPVEEINRNKSGFRIKALRAAGFNTVADITAASVGNISSVHGISEDSAHQIKKIAAAISEEVGGGVKLKLSSDNKDEVSTEIVTLLAQYKGFKRCSEQAKRLLDENQKVVAGAKIDVKPLSGAILWFFTSKARKQKAVDAYELLKSNLSGEYGRAGEECIRESLSLKSMTPEEAWEDFNNDSIRSINILEEIRPDLLANSDTSYGLPEDLAREIQEECFFPDGLLCELRRYQELGVKYILHQGKVLLGDEMGLGKTVQAIAVMVSLKNTGATHFIVVCPASVLLNWCREIRKHSKLPVIKVHGYDKRLSFDTWVKDGGVAVTTYETTGIFNLESKFQYSLCVVDEAHYIKNPEANRTYNVKKILAHADRILFMTGTALENKVSEMTTLISMLQPQVARSLHGVSNIAYAPQYRTSIAPVYYRRKREDVLTELPELIENKEWCSLMPEEEQIYEEAVLRKRYADARRVSWSVDDLRLSSKANRLLELIEEAKDDGRKVIVFSFFLDTIKKVSDLCRGNCTSPINGSVSPQKRQEIIDEFDNAPAGMVLPAQIQSGGTGLNIQSASVVIICEPQFKPSIENQAISRAYRMGQTRNVLVYRLLCENTVDEKLDALLSEKQAIFDAFADTSVAAEKAAELDIDNTKFGEIIQEEIERINNKRKTA